MMATRSLPEPVGIEYVPYIDEDEAIAPQPQVFRPTLVAGPKPPSYPAPAPVSQSLPRRSPVVSPSTRMLLTMAVVVVLLASFLVHLVHSHIPQAARARHPAATVLTPEAVAPAKPSAYGEAFVPASPAQKPRTRHAVATTPPPDDSSQSALH
jgi:hypothetical protein